MARRHPERELRSAVSDTEHRGGQFGNPWLNLGKTGQLKQNSPATSIGDNWALLRGYDRNTGVEKWTVYTDTGTSAMTATAICTG